MVRVVPNSAKARLGYGYALLQAGRNDEAARQFEAGLKIIPDYPELLTTLAMTKINANNCSQAWPLLNRALSIDPSHADTHRRMGDCYYKEGKVQEAESMYHQAVNSISYPDAMLYFMWGQSLEDTGQKVPAIAAYERGAFIDPGNYLIQQKLAVLK
jgi:tetratricopeptide (TPR) repeat protein